MNDYLNGIKDGELFDRTYIMNTIKSMDSEISNSTLCRKLKNLLDTGDIVRAGRNVYYKPEKKVYLYDHEYSELSKELAKFITEEYPVLDFRIFETVQLNEFINHQIGNNVIMLYVEENLGNFIFDSLRERFSNVLLRPTVDEYHKYWHENMIIIRKLPTESPKGKNEFWHTTLEKMLVDVMIDKLIMSSFSKSEYSAIYETAFERFIINEPKLFRYARRRKISDKLLAFLEKETHVKLRWYK